MDVKTLKQARCVIARLEGDVKSLEHRCHWQREEMEKAEKAREKALDKLDDVSERVNDLELLDALLQALADYKTFGWTDRLDAALAMVG